VTGGYPGRTPPHRQRGGKWRGRWESWGKGTGWAYLENLKEKRGIGPGWAKRKNDKP